MVFDHEISYFDYPRDTGIPVVWLHQLLPELFVHPKSLRTPLLHSNPHTVVPLVRTTVLTKWRTRIEGWKTPEPSNTRPLLSQLDSILDFPLDHSSGDRDPSSRSVVGWCSFGTLIPFPTHFRRTTDYTDPDTGGLIVSGVVRSFTRRKPLIFYDKLRRGVLDVRTEYL